jgi:transcriptional regulator with XRE-family HTH domain
MDQARTIGDRVREARKRRGFTQDDLARAAGVSKSLVSKLEQQSINDIRLETAHKIAAALDVSTSALVPRGDAPAPSPENAEAWQHVRSALDGTLDPNDPGNRPWKGSGPPSAGYCRCCWPASSAS